MSNKHILSRDYSAMLHEKSCFVPRNDARNNADTVTRPVFGQAIRNILPGDRDFFQQKKAIKNYQHIYNSIKYLVVSNECILLITYYFIVGTYRINYTCG